VFGDETVNNVRAVIEANDLTLTAALAPQPSNVGAAVILRARGNLTIGTNINVQGDLTLEAGSGSGNNGVIAFATARATELRGANITLNANRGSSAQPMPSDQDLTIVARGDLTINADLNAGTGVMELEAGEGDETGSVDITSMPRIVASAITLRYDAAVLTGAAPAQFLTSDGMVVRPTLVYGGVGGAGAQAALAWSVQDIRIEQSGDYTLNAAI